MVALTGPGTTYITPAVLTRAPTGIDWTTIPTRRSSTVEQAAEQANICLRATGMVDGTANQVLRATLDTELFTGPDWKVTISPSTLVARVMCSRWPILSVVSCQVSSAMQFPRQWNVISPTLTDIEKPAIGVYGSSQAADSADGGAAILLAPGAISWWMGRGGWRIQLQYVSGWPHTSLTVAANQGASIINVDDITGWGPPGAGLPGATGIFYDGMQQEVAQVTAVTPSTLGAVSGPGTATLASPLAWPHGQGTLFTTMPQTIINACIDYATSMALERGATATTIQTMSGAGTGGGPITAQMLRDWADAAVKRFARVW